MIKKKLNLVRGFLKKMPQLAFSGTTSERAISRRNNGLLEIDDRHYFKIGQFKGRTRAQVKKIYLSVNGALGMAIHHARLNIRVIKGKILVCDLQGNRVSLDKLEKKPVIALVIDPEKNMTEGQKGLVGSVAIHVNGAKKPESIFVDTMGNVKSKTAKQVTLPLTDADIIALNREWEKMKSNTNKMMASDISAITLTANFLTRRMVGKALKHLNSGSSRK